MIDRIDIHIEVPPVPYRELRGSTPGSDSASLRDQVQRARRIQHERFAGNGTTLNARMSPRQLRKVCALDDAGERLLRQAMTELGLSARAHDKVLRVARTIADLEGQERIHPDHLGEAIMYRRLDRQLQAVLSTTHRLASVLTGELAMSLQAAIEEFDGDGRQAGRRLAPNDPKAWPAGELPATAGRRQRLLGLP